MHAFVTFRPEFEMLKGYALKSSDSTKKFYPFHWFQEYCSAGINFCAPTFIYFINGSEVTQCEWLLLEASTPEPARFWSRRVSG